MGKCGREERTTPLELQLYDEQIPLNPSSRASQPQLHRCLGMDNSVCPVHYRMLAPSLAITH